MTGRDVTVAENRPETWPRKIRTTMEPDREYEVGEAEYTDLSRQGLIVKGGK